MNYYFYILTKQNGQFVLEEDYRFTGYTGSCRYSEFTPVGSIKLYNAIKVGDEESMATKLESGPVNACIDGLHWGFQLYDHGIFKDNTCDGVTTNVSFLIVGLRVENDTKYWICRNSWCTSWGEKGIIRVLRGVNTCGIAEIPFQVVDN